jgi:hypothetical protein
MIAERPVDLEIVDALPPELKQPKQQFADHNQTYLSGCS